MYYINYCIEYLKQCFNDTYNKENGSLQPIITNFIFSLGIVVANCPEGLLSTVTVALAITAKKTLKRKHPAVFPDKIPYDFIQCFCPEDGIVLDPFIGCGSTAVMAKKLGRKYIGIDISQEYCDLAKERIEKDV